VLRDGRIEQVGSPRDLYERPHNLFVAQFIGSPRMNVLSAAGASSLMASAPSDAVRTIGVRPEHLSVVGPEAGVLHGNVRLAEYTGAITLLHVELADGRTCLVVHDGIETPPEGAEIGLAAKPGNLHFFDDAGIAIRARRS
jgi:ABC-type sugar transport system ATPase subunit